MASPELDQRILSGTGDATYEKQALVQLLSGTSVGVRGKNILRAESKYFPLSTTNEDPSVCINCSLGGNKGKSQIRVGGAAAPKTYVIRIQSLPEFMRHNAGFHIPSLSSLDASHLCNSLDSRCIRASHLTLESNAVNTTRRCCFMFGVPGEPNYQESYSCPHTPPCMLTAHTMV